MVTMETLSSVIENDVLHELYLARELALSDVTEDDKRNLNELYKREKETYDELLSALKNVPNISAELIQFIENKIEKYVDNHAEINSYFDEKLFKNGIIDGIILMMEVNKKLSAR